MNKNENYGYSEILKSSSIMAFVSLVVMILGYVRTKYAATFLSAPGVGLMSTYSTLFVFISSIACLGITSSGVREISRAQSVKDKRELSLLISVVRRTCFMSGLIFLAIFFLVSPYLNNYYFQGGLKEYEILIIGLTLFLLNLTSGEMSILQGLRQINDIARVNIINAVTLLLFSLFFIKYFGNQGILLALFFNSVSSIIVSKWMTFGISQFMMKSSWSESFRCMLPLLKFGVVFLWNGFLTNGVVMVVTLLITSTQGISAVGIYSAGFALSSLLVNFILSAMATDYYPRLSAFSKDFGELNRMVNEQIEIAILLIIPGLLALVIYAPYVIRIFYSKEFLLSINAMRWFVLGCFLKVFIWPVSFIFLALKKKYWSITLETGFSVLYIVLSFFGLRYFSLEGIALAFLMSYVVYGFLTINVAKKLTYFRLAKKSKNIFLIGSIFLGLAIVFVIALPEFLAMIMGTILFLGVCSYSLNVIAKRLNVSILHFFRENLHI